MRGVRGVRNLGGGSGASVAGGWLTQARAQTKGTFSFGRRHNKTHTLCRRCGRRAFHIQKKVCGACGYPAARRRNYNWSNKARRRRTTGTGRQAHLKEVQRKFNNGFRTQVTEA